MKIPKLSKKRLIKQFSVMLTAIAVCIIVGVGPLWGSGSGGHEEVKGWQKTDWYRVLNFSVLAIALFIVLRKPVSQALTDRIKGIQEELQDLEARKTDIEQQLAQYNDKLAKLDKAAQQVIDEYVRQGKEAKARILKEAEVAAEKLKEQATKNIENEFARAKSELQAQIVDKALIQAEQLIKDQISTDDQERLVDEYLNKVVA